MDSDRRGAIMVGRGALPPADASPELTLILPMLLAMLTGDAIFLVAVLVVVVAEAGVVLVAAEGVDAKTRRKLWRLFASLDCEAGFWSFS